MANISTIADISDSRAISSTARAWSSLLYSTTGGQAPTLTTTETPVAQLLRQIVTRRRVTRRRLEHPSLAGMGFVHGLELFGQPADALARVAEGQHQQKDRECGGAVADCSARPCRPVESGQELAVTAARGRVTEEVVC